MKSIFTRNLNWQNSQKLVEERKYCFTHHLLKKCVSIQTLKDCLQTRTYICTQRNTLTHAIKLEKTQKQTPLTNMNLPKIELGVST